MILAGATVVQSLDPVRIVVGDLRIEDGRVIGVGRFDGKELVHDCTGCLVIPGNVCAHTHLYSALARGMPYALDPPEDFVQILQRVWWRLDRALDEDGVRASATVGALEALLSGTTTVIDHHASPNAIDGSLDVIAAALGSLGIRSVLCYETTDRDGPGRAYAGIEENRRYLEATAAGRFPLARGLVGAHASFTLGDETLCACAELARGFDTGLHIHLAEDEADELDSVARHGGRTVTRLADADALDERTLLAHCVHLDDHEIDRVLAANATIVHNARSNMNNSIGRARVGALGPRVALGTDGIGNDMFEESRTAYFRLREDDGGAGVDWALARLAEGARIAGRCFGEPLLGTLEPGAPADLAVLDYTSPAPMDEKSFPGHWIFGLSARNVRDVIVAGEWAVRDRRLTRADQTQLAREARVAAASLWHRLETLGAHEFEPEGASSWHSTARAV
jgi:putative selenium metabolism protein SsnA